MANSSDPTARILSLASSDPSVGAETRLLLICQAEGLRNRYDGLAGYEEGDDNAGLTAVGWEQTNELAAWLKTHERIDVLLSAPQLRSRLTAQRIGQALGLPVKVRSDLPRFALERIQPPGAGSEMPKYLASLFEQPPPEPSPEYRDFTRSVQEVVDLVLEEYWGKTIALVLNGVAVASIVRAFFGAQTLPIAIQHAAIAEVNRRAGIWQLAYVNRREHLPKPILSPLQGQTNAVASEASLESEELARVEEVYNRLGTRSLAGIPQAGRAQRMRDLLRWVKIPPEMRILDVGTGAGQLATMLAEDGAAEVVGIDVSPVTLEAAEYQRLARPSTAASRVTYRLAPAHSLPFSDERFDAEFCRLVLQHARKPDRALQELVRVLKTGGLFVLAELLGVEDPVRRATQTAIEERRNGAHITVRTADQLRRLLTAAGLTIEAEKTAVFDRELDDWLSDMDADQASRAAVRDMMEAGIETDASGLHVRRQGSKLLFEQRFLYIRAVKK